MCYERLPMARRSGCRLITNRSLRARTHSRTSNCSRGTRLWSPDRRHMMKTGLGQLLLMFLVLFCECVSAQTDTGTPDTGGPKPAYTYQDQTPPTQPGPQPAFTYPDTTPSLDFLSESIENSSITLGIMTGFSYSSNAYATNGSNSNWWLYQVTPSIRIQQFFPKFSWRAGYSGGYQTYNYSNGHGNANTNNSLFSQNADAGFIWQLSPHWQLMANNSFHYSANPFGSNPATPGHPTMNNPNPIFYTPFTRITQNLGTMTLTDRISKVDTLSFNGTANLRRTSTYNLLTSVPFYNLVSYGGRASYAHQLSPRLTLGAGYDYNSLDFGKGVQRSGIQTISATVDYLIRPNMTISGWIGPEYTQTKSVITLLGQTFITHNSLWSTALGANFGWQTTRNALRLGFSRQVSDGGGIIATSQVNSVHGDYRRMLAPKWDATIGATYFHDVSTTTTTRNFNNFFVNAAVDYKISRSFHADANYGFTQVSQSNAFLIGSSGHYQTNIFGASISYSWNHPLGR